MLINSNLCFARGQHSFKQTCMFITIFPWKQNGKQKSIPGPKDNAQPIISSMWALYGTLESSNLHSYSGEHSKAMHWAWHIFISLTEGLSSQSDNNVWVSEVLFKAACPSLTSLPSMPCSASHPTVAPAWLQNCCYPASAAPWSVRLPVVELSHGVH